MAGHKGSHTSVEFASTHMPKARTLGPTTCKWFTVMVQSAQTIRCNKSSYGIVHKTLSIARSDCKTKDAENGSFHDTCSCMTCDRLTVNSSAGLRVCHDSMNSSVA